MLEGDAAAWFFYIYSQGNKKGRSILNMKKCLAEG